MKLREEENDGGAAEGPEDEEAEVATCHVCNAVLMLSGTCLPVVPREGKTEGDRQRESSAGLLLFTSPLSFSSHHAHGN